MKESAKQIKARITNEVRNQYAHRLEETKAQIDVWKEKYIKSEKEWYEIHDENNKLKEENDSLKQEITQYKEWIERMQDFCNLPEEERMPAFKTYMDEVQSNLHANETFDNIMKMFAPMLSYYC